MSFAARRARLLSDLGRLRSLAVAFSGGVDSTVLLHAAHAVLGDRAVGVIADSPSLPRRELAAAREAAAAIWARLVEVSTRELSDARYVANTGDRCYFCKRALFDAMELVARREGLAALAFGEITDDAADDRPGARAAREAGVLAPLSAAGFTKDDVRRYAREAGLAAAGKPASACLASRVPVGTPVTAAALARVERAEATLHDAGFAVVRVRDHGRRARLEVGEDELEEARARSAVLAGALRGAGFQEWELAPYVPPARRVAACPSPNRSETELEGLSDS